MTEPTELEIEMGNALADECMQIFGATWGNDVHWRLARRAISALADQKKRPEG